VIAGFIGVAPQTGIDTMRDALDTLTSGVAFEDLK